MSFMFIYRMVSVRATARTYNMFAVWDRYDGNSLADV